jgi:predicted glycogen debranching enzyme
MTRIAVDDRTEWLETDGRGGFASGTTAGIRTRRYHALLLPALTPPTGRVVLANGFDASVETDNGVFALSTQRYQPDVLHPDGASRIVSFASEPWPTWEFALPDATVMRQELFLEQASGACWISWTVVSGGRARLNVRPFLSGRDYHSLHRENPAFRFDVEQCGASFTFRPYNGLPPITLASNGGYRHEPQWYRNFLYTAERERGLDDTEDLAAPGVFVWSLDDDYRRAALLLRVRPTCAFAESSDVLEAFDAARASELARRSRLRHPLDRAADAYLVQRGSGRTIVAGYPWFTDWGRDTFIAVRGLCLATGRFDEARDILLQWARCVDRGMLPNRFPDSGETPEFNSVDASLWYVVAVGDFLRIVDAGAARLDAAQRGALEEAVAAIVSGYAEGTRFGIRMDDDGLLAAGVPGQQLTWMDARVGDREITPRIGKPVEIQALWYNAVAVASAREPRWRGLLAPIRRSFRSRFWIAATGSLADVVDVDHVPGTWDETLRPNQILAVGGLPLPLLGRRAARQVVDRVEAELLTPVGLRSLTPGSAAYVERYAGGPSERDGAYHQGTVWPWLLGPFVEAWIRTHGATNHARLTARRRFLDPLAAHLHVAGLSHVSEIADAIEPFTPRGCPFQAWSLGEYIRLHRDVLAVRGEAVDLREAACV